MCRVFIARHFRFVVLLSVLPTVWFFFLCTFFLLPSVGWDLFYVGLLGGMYPGRLFLTAASSVFIVDNSSVVFLIIVLLVCFGTQLYSVGYMSADRRIFIFEFLLSLFAASMCLLVVSNAFIVFFLMWEMVGVSSFLLIGFLNDRRPATNAAFKAICANRVPDLCLLVFFIVVYAGTGLSDFISTRTATTEYAGFWFEAFTALLVVFAACGKSAQIGFTGWLISAMEGPTPVSALMHAATLVTAGVVLLIKSVFLINGFLWVVFLIGLITSIYCGLSALVEHDFKAIVAYSTSSQMGFAFMLVGVGDTTAAYAYISIHALFKALLFWSAGVVGHVYSSQYSVRVSSTTINTAASTGLVVSSFCLVGVPFISGFYSKEMLVFSTLQGTPFGGLCVFILLSQILSICYTCRVLYLIVGRLSETTIHNSSFSVFVGIPVVIFSFISIIFGVSLLGVVGRTSADFLFGSGSVYREVVQGGSFVGGWLVVFVILVFMVCFSSYKPDRDGILLSRFLNFIVFNLYAMCVSILCVLYTVVLAVVWFVPFIYLVLFFVAASVRRALRATRRS